MPLGVVVTMTVERDNTLVTFEAPELVMWLEGPPSDADISDRNKCEG